MREFYKERDVVIEERRMRTDSSPSGRLHRAVHRRRLPRPIPISSPTVGWTSDLNSFSATDAQKFFDKYYIPSNMVVAVVGDVKTAEAMPIIEKYFGRLPTQAQAGRAAPPPSRRRIPSAASSCDEPSQPFYLEGYHRPDYRSPDDAVYDAISDLMSNGRTSRLYRSLVRDKKISAFAAGFTGFPGNKYPHLFAFYAVPVPGPHTAGAGRRHPC